LQHQSSIEDVMKKQGKGKKGKVEPLRYYWVVWRLFTRQMEPWRYSWLPSPPFDLTTILHLLFPDFYKYLQKIKAPYVCAPYIGIA
jgi:hypothetical protein